MSNDTVLRVSNLSLSATSSGRPLVKDISFELRSGQCLGLVGESGSGKSLTLRSILDLLPPGVQKDSGEIAFGYGGGGLEIVDPRGVRGRGIAMVFQDSSNTLNPLMRIQSILAEPLRQHAGLSRAAARARAAELLAEVGLKDNRRVLDSFPHQLSGGQRQRVSIAAALACEPAVLLCDEPTTALDVTTQAQILTLLDQLSSDRGMSMIFVSHDLGAISHVADQIAVMFDGLIVERGAADDILFRPTHDYTQMLTAAIPRIAVPKQTGGDNLGTA